ncbi:MAG TPA: DUF3365 domain-containing protein [Gammaproteobacteria bacterium]|nr:DUF3365 domain-containing protein [Gammaproteobacteria bacterium]
MESIRMRVSAAVLAAVSMTASGMAAAGDMEQRLAASRQATAELMKQLGGALKRELKSQGPAAAISVCRDLAPQIAGRLSRENGWRVTRVGTRVRNPLLGMPDAWEQGVLEEFQARAAKGEKYANMSHSEVVEEGGRRYFRFMKAIGTKDICLTCHGGEANLPAQVKTSLDRDYPMDRARGYRVGDLRGAVSIKQPLDIPLREVKAGD